MINNFSYSDLKFTLGTDFDFTKMKYDGDGLFRPSDTLTRAEIATILSRIAED